MGRKAKWTTVEQLLDAYNNGIKTKQGIQNMYFKAILKGHTDRVPFFREVLDAIEQQEKEDS